MAQVLKYLAGGTAPKPIKVGNSYYTADLLKKELYGSKLDDYIKFQDFDSKRAQTFRNNLEKLVDAIIDGSLRLEGNSLVDSGGRWKNNGEYAKAKLFGKLNKDLQLNNESLDVANYLIRALNSNKLSTYTAPSEYNLFESDTFKTYDNIQDDELWLKETVDSRRNRIAKSLEDEASKLTLDLNYRDKYSYEGWQDAEWDNRANATIQKLKNAANILKNPAVKGIDLKLQLNSLGYGDLMDLLAELEIADPVEKKPASPVDGNGLNPSKGKLFSVVPLGLFTFTPSKIVYKGNEYTYGTPEFNSILDLVIKDENGEDITIGAYLKRIAEKQSKVDRSHPDFATAPSGYNYFINVTQNFKRGNNKSNIRAAYLLRRDPLDASNSILRVVYGDKRAGSYYLYDGNTKTAYAAGFDSNGNPYRIEGARPIRLDSLDTVVPTSVAESMDNFSTDLIFGQHGNFDVEKLDKFIENNVDLINNDKLVINNYIGGLRKLLKATLGTTKRKKGELKLANKTYYYIDFYGTDDRRPLRIYFKNKAFRDRANIENDLDAYWILGVRLPKWKPVSAPGYLGNSNDYIDTYTVPLPNNKEGGVLKALLGVKVSDEVPEPVNKQPKPKKKEPLNGRDMTLSSVNNYNKELEAGLDFDAGLARRLAYSLIDLGSAVASLIPGANLASTAVGVGMTAATAGEDFVDALKGKMSLGEAAWNTASSLGLDAISLIPGLKAAKIGKTAKFVLKAIPRLIGYALAYNMLSTESAAAIGKTMGKISSGNFDLLTTLDFTNITHAIRIATMIGRDTKGTYRKGRNMLGKKTELVEISGKVNGQEIKTTVNKEDITTSKFKVKRIDLDKVKQKLAEEANRRDDITKKPLILEKDAEGKLLTNEDGTPKMKLPLFEVGDVKNTNTSAIRDHNLYESEVGHPKKLFEGWFGYKGYNSPISDAYIALRWDPILKINGQMTNKRATEISQTDKKLSVSPELKLKVNLMVDAKMLTRKLANEILEGGPSRKQFIELEALKEGVTPADYIRDSYNLDRRGIILLLNKFVSEQSALKLAELNKKYESISKRRANKLAKIDEAARIKLELLDKIARIRRERAERRAAKKAAALLKLEAEKLAARLKALAQSLKRKELRDLKKYAETILGKNKALSDKFNNLTPRQLSKVIRSAHNIALLGGKNNYDTNFLNSLLWTFNPSNPNHLKQGGRLDRGFALINAYKSGGYMIPKFWDGGDVNDITYTGSPFLEDVPNFTVFYGIDDLNKYFYEKNTPAQNSVSTFYRDHPELLNNGVTVSGKTYRLAEDAYKQSVAAGEFIPNIKKYLKNHTWKLFNAAITKLRGYRKQINTLLYGDELKGSLENQKKLLELIENFNKGYIEILGPIGGRKDPKLFNRNGGATLERHIAFLTSLLHANDRNFEDAEGNKVFLDNAFLLNPGTYPTTPLNTNTVVKGTEGNPAGTPTDGTSGTGGGSNPDEGKKKTDATRLDMSDLNKPITKPNPIQALRMSELAGALATNAKATNELLKYKAPTIDAPYKLAYLAGKYPVIAATLNLVGKVNTMASTPVTSDIGPYLINALSAYSKGLTAMQNAYSLNYDAHLVSKDKATEAGNYSNAASVQANNENVTKYVTAENMKNKNRADLYSSNFSLAIKPYLLETRTWLLEAETNRLKAKYEVENLVAKDIYNNDLRVLNEGTVANILSNAGSDRARYEKDATGNRRSNEAIIQLYYAEHPDKASEYQQLRFDIMLKYSKKLIENSTLMSPNLNWLTTTKEKYDFKKLGGSLTPNDRIKLLKIKDYNAARRLDSKESIKSITKDKEEFGKNYRAMSAGTLKMLERTLK